MGSLRAFCLVLALLVAGVLPACERTDMAGDDLSAAQMAFANHDWLLAERLLERYLRYEENADKRWEAWSVLLEVINAGNAQPRTTVEYLEAMRAEYEGDDAHCKVILQRLGQACASLRRYERAVEVWSEYVGLGGLGDTEMVEGYRNLAAMQFALRRFDTGEESLQQCLALPVDDKEKIHCMLDLADHNTMRERWQEVVNLSQQVLDTAPGGSDGQQVRGQAGFLLADALEHLNRKEEALRQFELVRADYPNPDVIDNRIAYLRKKQGK